MAGERAPTSPAAPPVGEEPAVDILATVARFSALRLPSNAEKPLVPDELKKFQGETALTNLKLHMSENHLAKESEGPVGEVINEIISRPAVDHVVFFTDARLETLEQVARGEAPQQIYGVSNAAHAAMLKSHGYARVEVNFPGGFSTLPPRLSTAGAGSSTDVPDTVRLTIEKPTVNPRAERTAAEQITELFEVKVTDSMGTPFSPLRFWTDEQRAKSAAWSAADTKLKGALANHLNRYAHVYCYIRAQEDPPSTMKQSLGDLKNEASKELKARDDDTEQPTEQPTDAGSARKKQRVQNQLTWFQKAIELANERVHASPCS